MAAETAQAVELGWLAKLRLLPRRWLDPRSEDRDEAFRERSIRVAIAIVILIGVVSFIFTTFVFQNEWTLISLPTTHVVILLGFIAAAYEITRVRVDISARIVVGTSMVAAFGFIVGTAPQSPYTILVLGIPLFMTVVLLTSLVMPRNAILYSSIGSLLFYVLAVFSAQNAFNTLSSFDLSQPIINAVVLLASEGIILHRLRVEFDSRLDAMRASIHVAEIAQQQAETARERAEQSDKAKSQFLANMSHELRTPLNAIIGYDEAMIGGLAGEFTPQQTKLLGHIQYNSRRLLGLINDVLDLSKIASGSLQIFLAPMSPRNVVRETVESLRSLADEKGIYLNVEISEAVPEIVLGDANKLQQILANLLSNAIKFTETGGVTVDVVAHDSAHWQFGVRDTGIGLPANAESYIFEPFQQVDGSEKRKYKGTGLGLAITKRLVDGLGGSVVVESSLGKGATFTVKLPRAQIPSESVTHTQMREAEQQL